MRSSSSRLVAVAVLVTVLAVGLAAALPAAAQPPAFQSVVTARTNNPGFTGGADFGLTVGVPPGPAGDLLIFLVGVKINPATTTPPAGRRSSSASTTPSATPIPTGSASAASSPPSGASRTVPRARCR